MKSDPWIHVYVVYRIDYYQIKDKDLRDIHEHVITIKEVFNTPDEAMQEVERLTKLRQGKENDIVYFWQSAKYYPEGRNISSPNADDNEVRK
jgi:hypothetical protein